MSNEVKPRKPVAEGSSNEHGKDNVEENLVLGKELGNNDKLSGKGKIQESDPSLPHISRLDPEVLASLPPEIPSEISDVYNIKFIDNLLGNHTVSDRHYIANTHAMDRFSAGTSSKRQKLKFPILEGSSSKVVKSEIRNMECDNRHNILKREEGEHRQDGAANTFWLVDLPASSELDPSVHSALPLSLRLEIEQQYRKNNSLEEKNASAIVSREEIANRPQLLTSNPGNNVQKTFLENSRTLISDTSDSRNMSIGKGGRQASRDDSVSIFMSQLDITVLQELPPEMQHGILDSIRAQRPSEASHEEALLCKKEASHHTISANDEVEQKVSCERGDALFVKRLWKGNPPEWIKNFKLSDCILLSLIAECHNKVSSLLQEFLPGQIYSKILSESVQIFSKSILKTD